jgi:hypothetical protein
VCVCVTLQATSNDNDEMSLEEITRNFKASGKGPVWVCAFDVVVVIVIAVVAAAVPISIFELLLFLFPSVLSCSHSPPPTFSF